MGVAPCEIWKSLSSREFSSAGRASALQAEGQRFDPVNSHRSRGVAVSRRPVTAKIAGSIPVGTVQVEIFETR